MYSARDLREEKMALLRRVHRQREKSALKELKNERERLNKEKMNQGNGNGLNPFKGFKFPFNEIHPRDINRRENRSDFNRGFSRLGLYINRRGFK